MRIGKNLKRISMLLVLFIGLFSLSACGSDYKMDSSYFGGTTTITIRVTKSMEIESWTFKGTSNNASISKNSTQIDWHTSFSGETAFNFDLGAITLEKGDIIIVMAMNCESITENLTKA